MHTVGKFAEIVSSSIRTLRYYDKIDLFKPDRIDLFTGYRYYSDKQIEEFNFIKKLQSVGFSLDEIKECKDNLTEYVLLKKKEQLLQERKDIDRKIKELDEMRSNLGDNKTLWRR